MYYGRGCGTVKDSRLSSALPSSLILEDSVQTLTAIRNSGCLTRIKPHLASQSLTTSALKGRGLSAAIRSCISSLLTSLGIRAWSFELGDRLRASVNMLAWSAHC